MLENYMYGVLYTTDNLSQIETQSWQRSSFPSIQPSFVNLVQ